MCRTSRGRLNIHKVTASAFWRTNACLVSSSTNNVAMLSWHSNIIQKISHANVQRKPLHSDETNILLCTRKQNCAIATAAATVHTETCRIWKTYLIFYCFFFFKAGGGGVGGRIYTTGISFPVTHPMTGHLMFEIPLQSSIWRWGILYHLCWTNPF